MRSGLLFLISTAAWGSPCTLQPFQAYLSLGQNGCTIGPYTFSNFTYVPFGNGTVPDLSNVFIDPRTADATVRGGSLQTGFSLASSSLWAAAFGQTTGLMFGVRIVPNTPEAALLLLGYTPDTQYLYDVTVPVTETIAGTVTDQNGLLFSNSVVYNIASGSGPGSGGGMTVPIPASSTFLDVTVTRSFQPGTNGAADIRGTWLGFQQEIPSTPEPSGFFLQGIGIAALCVARAVRRSVRASP